MFYNDINIVGNMSNILITLAGVLIPILLAIIGYFMRQQVVAINTLVSSVHELNTSVEVIRSTQRNNDKEHEIINNRLNSHSDLIHKHGEDLAILKEKTK